MQSILKVCDANTEKGPRLTLVCPPEWLIRPCSAAVTFNLQQVSDGVHGLGVSKLELIDLVFVNAGVKINGAYYRDMLLTQKLLHAIREISSAIVL